MGNLLLLEYYTIFFFSPLILDDFEESLMGLDSFSWALLILKGNSQVLDKHKSSRQERRWRSCEKPRRNLCFWLSNLPYIPHIYPFFPSFSVLKKKTSAGLHRYCREFKVLSYRSLNANLLYASHFIFSPKSGTRSGKWFQKCLRKMKGSEFDCWPAASLMEKVGNELIMFYFTRENKWLIQMKIPRFKIHSAVWFG